MTLDELRYGIESALLRGSVIRPSPDDNKAHADWIEWMTIYLYEFVIRSRQKGMKLDQAERLAYKASEKQWKTKVAARDLSYQLPKLPPGIFGSETEPAEEVPDDHFGASLESVRNERTHERTSPEQSKEAGPSPPKSPEEEENT